MDQSWKDYLYVTKRGRRGLFALLFIVMLVFAIPFFYNKLFPPAVGNDRKTTAALEALEKLQKDSTRKKYDNQQYAEGNSEYRRAAYKTYDKETTGTLFAFDPNTLDAAGWVKLGAKEKTAQTILNYRSKGGKFKSAEDIRKIWGISPALADRIIPFARVTETANTRNYPTPTYEKKVYEKAKPSIISINTTDTTMLATLPGIGAGYSRRILKFRDRLGGFVSVNQVAETYMLPDSVFQKIMPYITVDASAIEKINVNLASEDQLKQHPYIRWQLAKVIIAYRTQHGAFGDVQELRKIGALQEEDYKKIVPYLKVN